MFEALWRAAEMQAGFAAKRDILDLAMVTDKEPDALWRIALTLLDRRDVLLPRIAAQESALREAFAELEVLDYRRSFEECVMLVTEALGKA